MVRGKGEGGRGGLTEVRAFVIKKVSRMQDSALHYLPDLTLTTTQHHKLFVALHPELAKKKVHYSLHGPEDLGKRKRNLNCFSAERFHKLLKARAATCFKGDGAMELAITKTIICCLLAAVVSPSYGQPCIAVKACPLPSMGALSMLLCGAPFLAVSKFLDCKLIFYSFRFV